MKVQALSSPAGNNDAMMSKLQLPLRTSFCILIMTLTACTSPASRDGEHPETADLQLTLEGFWENNRDVNNTGRKSFFCFSNGSFLQVGHVMKLSRELRRSGKDAEIKETFRDAYDIFFDADHGIATNSTIAGWELGVGNGGIVDMGRCGFDEVKEAPEDGYKKALKISEMLPGHTYCVRTANGREYGKFHIVSFDQDAMTLDFTWSFQAGGSRQFKPQ